MVGRYWPINPRLNLTLAPIVDLLGDQAAKLGCVVGRESMVLSGKVGRSLLSLRLAARRFKFYRSIEPS